MQNKILAFFLALVVMLSLVACTPEDPESTPCETCVDSNGDYLCDVCGTLIPLDPDLPGEDDGDGDNQGTGDVTPDDDNDSGNGNGGITVNPDGSIDLPGDKFN